MDDVRNIRLNFYRGKNKIKKPTNNNPNGLVTSDPLMEDFLLDMKLDSLFEQRKKCEFTELFEHRGKPDPEKVKERQEAHKRGLERHKNALQRQKQTEQKRRQRQKNNLSTEENEQRKQQLKQIPNSQKTSQQKQQRLDDILDAAYQKRQEQKQQVSNQQKQQKQSVEEKQQQKEQQQITEEKQLSKQEYQDKVAAVTKDFERTKKVRKKLYSEMDKSAPTEETKRISKDIQKGLDDIEQKMLDPKTVNAPEGINPNEWVKMSPEEKKRWLEKKRADELVRMEQKYGKKCKTPEERAWFKKNWKSIKNNRFVGTIDNICDLMGYKAIYMDIYAATNFILGKH